MEPQIHSCYLEERDSRLEDKVCQAPPRPGCPPQEHAPSQLLTDEQNETLFSLLGSGCQSLASAVVEVYIAEPSNPEEWTKKGFGVATFIKDNNKKSYFIRVYDIQKGKLNWEQEMYTSLIYKTPRPFFHTFDADECQAALNFSSEEEATKFGDAITRKQKEREERRKRNQQRRKEAQQGGTNAAVIHAVIDPKPKKAANQNKKNAKKQKPLKKADIGQPVGFTQIRHLGWDPDKGFDLQTLDPDMKLLFAVSGVSDDMARDLSISNYIRDFIEKRGGGDAVKVAAESIKLERPQGLPKPELSRDIPSPRDSPKQGRQSPNRPAKPKSSPPATPPRIPQTPNRLSPDLPSKRKPSPPTTRPPKPPTSNEESGYPSPQGSPRDQHSPRTVKNDPGHHQSPKPARTAPAIPLQRPKPPNQSDKPAKAEDAPVVEEQTQGNKVADGPGAEQSPRLPSVVPPAPAINLTLPTPPICDIPPPPLLPGTGPLLVKDATTEAPSCDNTSRGTGNIFDELQNFRFQEKDRLSPENVASNETQEGEDTGPEDVFEELLAKGQGVLRPASERKPRDIPKPESGGGLVKALQDYINEIAPIMRPDDEDDDGIFPNYDSNEFLD